jgi:predicted nuclease of predicted toxin-antitoxin system
MRFLVDECTGPVLATWLRAQGHDVYSVYEHARGIDDEQVIELVHDDNRILVTK